MGILVDRIKRKANHLFVLGLARVVETFPPLADWLRSHDFRDKAAVVLRLNANSIRAASPAVCDGLRYELDLNDDLQRMIYFNAYEQDLISTVLPLVNPNEVFFDVGGNVGFYALHAARLMQTGCVYAFEPEPGNFARLRKNCELNGFERRMRLHMLAVSDTVGQATFFRCDRNSGWGNLKGFPDVRDSELEVKTTTIDDFCNCEGISRIGFLKIDVEGHEPQVVAGAARMLGEKRIDYVFAEYVGCRLPSFGYPFRDFLSLFAQVGYQPDAISLSLVEAISRGQVPENAVCTNFLFKPKVSTQS
ncbi:MAG TPA: FkbM family methyltransferase [Candidatus Binataceae bacterium]|nr:FkbM family methyltransferase [Candidatus Binataceae bacterium]